MKRLSLQFLVAFLLVVTTSIATPNDPLPSWNDGAARSGKPVLMRLAEIDFIDDKAGKPVGINRFIGRRPIASFGNSDGDRQMVEWTAAAAISEI